MRTIDVFGCLCHIFALDLNLLKLNFLDLAIVFESRSIGLHNQMISETVTRKISDFFPYVIVIQFIIKDNWKSVQNYIILLVA